MTNARNYDFGKYYQLHLLPTFNRHGDNVYVFGDSYAAESLPEVKSIKTLCN